MENQLPENTQSNVRSLKSKPKINTKILAGVAGVIIVAVIAFLLLSTQNPDNNDNNSDTEQPGGVGSKEEMEERLAAVDFDKVALLEDVTGGSATGMAYYFFDEEAGFYNINAEFADLPEINLDEQFYEGWILNSATGEFKSTGETILADGKHINTFRSKRNYNSYDQYVLTIETRSGDKQPEKHVLEGKFMLELPTETENEDETTESESVSTGIYTDYSESLLANADNGDVVLFFKASWCPTCSALDKNIEENVSKIPNNLSILKVDYDNSDELQAKYNVTYQHTLVQVDSKGNQLAKWTGSFTLDELNQNIV